MVDSIQKRKESGFTIVEVMIVLAIAGLIILIVFLAVPALQRNSRNTQRSQDVSSILGGVSEFAAANNGSLTTLTNASSITDNAKTGYYEGAGVLQGNVGLDTDGAATLTEIPANDRVLVVTKAKCGTGNAAVPGPSRGVVALYLIEDTSTDGFAVKCQAS